MKKLAKGAKKVAKKIYAKARNDPEIRNLVKNTASQMKRELVSGLKMGLTDISGGRITGSGDYKVSGNIKGLGGYKVGSKISNSIVIEREEYITSIVSNSVAKAINISKYRYNPGNYTVNPWGSAVALGYESWEPLQAFLIYKPTSGNALNSADSSLGKVILAAQYNTFARDWDSILELENANDSVVGEPSQGLMLGIECSPAKRPAKTLYVSATDPNASGKSFYDLCDLYVSTSGLQGQSVRCGDLFIRYRTRLFNPLVRDTEMPSLYVGIRGTVAAANDSLPSTISNLNENFSSRVGGSVVITTPQVLTFTCRPLVGQVRMHGVYWRHGGSGTRASTSYVCQPSYLGDNLTVTQDIALSGGTIDGQAVTITSSGTASLLIFDAVLPVNTDKFTLTFSDTVGVASDSVNLQLLFDPFESSDF